MTFRKKSYSGSVTIPGSERKWVVYKVQKDWLVSRIGGYGKVYRFASKKEADRKLKELEEITKI